MDIQAAKSALSHLDIDENPISVRAKSRDFFWYSPVLKSRLDHVVADFAVSPRDESEVIEILKVCYEHDVPVTTRGAGTGNYGQAHAAGGRMHHPHAQYGRGQGSPPRSRHSTARLPAQGSGSGLH